MTPRRLGWSLAALLLLPAAGRAQDAAPAAPAPAKDAVAEAPSPTNKLTIAYYRFSSGVDGADINLRHTFPSSTVWVGGYHQDNRFDQARVGYEYDYRGAWLTVIPSVQAASHGFVGASIYAEAGSRLFAIGGAGRTNLHPYWNLGFDPNDYVQFGGGIHDRTGNSLAVFAIRDDRLGTGQTNTHFYFRRHVGQDWRWTIDAVREHGRGDDDQQIDSWSLSVDGDWRRWFARVARDEHVNYTADHQLRLAGGVRF